MNAPMDFLLSALSPEEQDELQQAVIYLTEHAMNGSTPPEGSMGATIGRLSKPVAQTIRLLADLLPTPRMKPFDEKLTLAQNAKVMGLDPRIAQAVLDRLDREHVEAGVAERMSTPAEQQSAQQAAAQPPSLREMIAAAMRTQQGGQP